MEKNVLVSFQNITEGDLSLPITSPVTVIKYLDNVGIQLNAAGANPLGTFEVQVSIDQANWTAIALPSTPTLSGTPTTIYLDLNQLSAPYLRVVFTPSVGSVGTLNSFITAKGI